MKRSPLQTCNLPGRRPTLRVWQRAWHAQQLVARWGRVAVHPAPHTDHAPNPQFSLCYCKHNARYARCLLESTLKSSTNLIADSTQLPCPQHTTRKPSTPCTHAKDEACFYTCACCTLHTSRVTPPLSERRWQWGEGQWMYMRAFIESGVSVYSQWNMVLDQDGKSGWGWTQCSPVTVSAQVSGRGQLCLPVYV